MDFQVARTHIQTYSLLTKKLWLICKGMKQKKILKIYFQNGQLKTAENCFGQNITIFVCQAWNSITVCFFVCFIRYEKTGSLWLWWSIDCNSTCSSLSQRLAPLASWWMPHTSLNMWIKTRSSTFTEENNLNRYIHSYSVVLRVLFCKETVSVNATTLLLLL